MLNLHFAATSFNRIILSRRLKNLVEQKGHSQLYGADRTFFLVSVVMCHVRVLCGRGPWWAWQPWQPWGTPRRKDCSTRGAERKRMNVNAKELAGIGTVSAWSLNWGSSRRTKRSEAGFTMREIEKERIGFLRDKPWIKVQRPWTWRCGPSNRARPASTTAAVAAIKEYASWRTKMNAVDVTKREGNCSRADTADKRSFRRIINCTCGFGGSARDFTTRRSYGCCRLHLG